MSLPSSSSPNSMHLAASPALSSHSSSSLSSVSSSSSSASSSSCSPPSRHSTVDTYKCAVPLQNPRTHDVFQSIVKGRKSWKTLRGGEVVWPPELEAALIEGLENYQPDDSRETRLLGRFPMRNRFISDWIFEKTAKRRTAKQVGSRLQQLRDTCGGKRLLNLLSPIRRPHPHPRALSPDFPHPHYPSPLHHYDPSSSSSSYPPSSSYPSSSSSDSSASSASQPATPTEAHATLQSLLYRGVEPRPADSSSSSSAYSYSIPETVVYIDLISEDGSAASTSSVGAEERAYQERGYTVTRASPHARPLREIDPTITFLSRSPASSRAQSHFAVHAEDGVVFEESTPLEPLEVEQGLGGNGDGARLYRTKLVPGFWDVIVRSGDASRYTIVQRVVQDSSASSSSSSSNSPSLSPLSNSSNPQSASTTIFAAMYRFAYSSSSSSSSHSNQPLQAYPSMHMEPQIQMHKQHQQDFGFDASSLLSMPVDNNNVDFTVGDVDMGHMNMMGFPASKTHSNPNTNTNTNINHQGGFFNDVAGAGAYWGTPSPGQPMSMPVYTGNNNGVHGHGGEQFLAPPFSMDSVSAYAL